MPSSSLSGRIRAAVTVPEVAPAKDYGFFGPGSVTWRVWLYPTSLLIGFARAVTIEELDPMLVASVQHTGQVKDRTPLRYDRTLQYFATVAFGDAESVLEASEILMKVHGRSVGPDPVTGRTFDANDPESQLWIHLTAWHSILYAYEVYGPGKLAEAEEAQYWNECATAAEFQTIDPDRVPRSREGVRQYFDEYRPKLVASDLAHDMFEFLANMPAASLPASVPGPLRRLINASTRQAVVATLPRWMRDLGGTPQNPLGDAFARLTTKPYLALIGRWTALELQIVRFLSPRTYLIIAPLLAGVEPENPRVYTVAEARVELGHPTTPREIYAEQLRRRADGAGPAPYARSHRDPVLEFDPNAEPVGPHQEHAA